MTDRVQLIDGERVYCPRRQEDVDVERCLACPYLEDLRADGAVRVVVCTAVARDERDLDALLL